MIDSELFPDTANDPRRLRLFCFPHAGGGTSQFYRWRRWAGDEVAIVPARLPGRESRLDQPPITSMDQLASIVADTIASLPVGPFALMGYSVGAHLAYRVACLLPRQGDRSPRALVVVASNGPGNQQPVVAGAEPGGKRIVDLPDDQLVDHIHGKYGGIPAVVRQNRAWLTAVAPALRADLRLLESAAAGPEQLGREQPLNCPVLAIGGREDKFVPPQGLSGWGAVSNGPLTTRQYPGGHFFLYQQIDAVGSGMPADSRCPEPLEHLLHFARFAQPL